MHRWKLVLLSPLLTAGALATPAVQVTVDTKTTLLDNDNLYTATAKSKGNTLGFQKPSASGPLWLPIYQPSGLGKPGDAYVAMRAKDASNVTYASSSNASDEPTNVMSSFSCSGGNASIFGASACGTQFPPGAPKCTIVLTDRNTGIDIITCSSIYSGYPCNHSASSGHVILATGWVNNDLGRRTQQTITCP